MITTNASWDAKNAAAAKQPIYVFTLVTLDNQTYVYTTHDLVAMGITGTLPTYHAWLKTPQGASQSIDVQNGSSSIGELACEIVDPTGAVRTLVGTTILEGATATLSVGYPGLAYDHFVALQTYMLYKVVPVSGYAGWTFNARDRQMNLKRTVSLHPENGGEISKSNPWIVQGTPAEIIQAIWLFGLGRDPSELDLAALALFDSPENGLFVACRPFFFQITEAFEAKQWLETEIYKVCGIYPIVTNTGQLSWRAFRPPAIGAVSVFAFTPDNMTILPNIDRLQIVNEVVFDFDADAPTPSELCFIQATSASIYQRSGQLSIQSKGLRTNWGAGWFCQDVAARMFRRFAGLPAGLRGGAPVYSIDAFLMTLPVWVGDFVTVTHPLMPDLQTGALGVTNRLMEVVDREPDYANGKVSYQLLDTGLTGTSGAGLLAPSDNNFIVETTEVY